MLDIDIIYDIRIIILSLRNTKPESVGSNKKPSEIQSIPSRKE